MRKIEQFLPPRYRTKKIRNFMASTTDQLFSVKDAMAGSFYIGNKPSGLYNSETDFYAPEIRKIREDYQLQPTFVIRNEVTGEIDASIFYEDILNVLKESGCDTDNHGLLFRGEAYSFAPPINPDMFVNYRDYYWYPEGIPAIEVDQTANNINGAVYKDVPLRVDGSPLTLTNDMHIRLIDGKDYMVTGVGRKIELIQVDYANNINELINYSSNELETDPLIKHPKDYFTMERGAQDKNTWSRTNSWLHKDAITNVVAGYSFKPTNERRAERPIICFDKDMVLFNYDQAFVRLIDFCEVNGTGNADGVWLCLDGKLRRYANGALAASAIAPEGRYVIGSGNHAGTEYSFRDGNFTVVQSKYSTNVEPIFDLFDEQGVSLAEELKYPNSTFAGNKIFSYDTLESGSTLDPVLGKYLRYKAFKESSDITFRNFMAADYGVGRHFYKKSVSPIVDNILKFTINSVDGNPTIFVNNKELPQLVVFSGVRYILDFTDLSTTADGWFKKYTPIRVYNDINSTFVESSHAHSRFSKVEVEFELGQVYYYTDETVMGRIMVREPDNITDTLHDVWKYKGADNITLYKGVEIKDPNQKIKLDYLPVSTKISVTNKGALVPQENITFKHDSITIDGVELNDFVEVRYQTNSETIDSELVTQELSTTLSNNPYNDDVTTFAYSEAFNHFASIVNNQEYISGSALTSNNYRDTNRDNSRGSVILRHTSNFPLLAFLLSDEDIGVTDSIRFSGVQYESFKRSIIVGVEERMRSIGVSNLNARDVLDEILLATNGLKTDEDSFADSYMMAAYRKYERIVLDANNRTTKSIVASHNNAIHVYTNNGLALNGLDYTISYDVLTGLTEFTFINFTRQAVTEIRYYTDIESTFAPATPAKFGLTKPKKPSLYVERDIFRTELVMLVGHDGSLSRAYTTVSDFNNNDIDARDLVMLEFESRVYNGISERFKRADFQIVNHREYREGKFRKTNKTKRNAQNYMSILFNKWATENYLDVTKNTTYSSNDPFTYNYGYSEDVDGEPLLGNWKGIYMHFYDTTTPHRTPWEMLGFDIKPEWWDSQYGNDYSSLNTAMWSDLEEGIIRSGERANTLNGQYLLNENIYRREGLSAFIPVKDDGSLKNPIEAGIIASAPEYELASAEWKYGDYSPVEFAWRASSEFAFNQQIAMFMCNPLEYVSKAWNTSGEFSEIEPPMNKKPHTNKNYIAGLSQWIYDLLLFKKLNADQKLNTNFNSQDILLAHKVGGFIDSDELRIYSESYNPRSTTNTALIPQDDINVGLYESRELGSVNYSGILIERVDNTTEIKPYEDGIPYSIGDVVIDVTDSLYYEHTSTVVVERWINSTFYAVGNEVNYDGKIYVCRDAHRATNATNPLLDQNKWTLKSFKGSDWKLLNGAPSTKKTNFKVSGYDVTRPYFTSIIGNSAGRKKVVRTPSRISVPTNYARWVPNVEFEGGDIFRLPNERIIVMTTVGVTKEEPETGTFVYKDNVDTMTNMLRQEIMLEPLEINGEKQYDIVQYGTVFKDLNSLANFIIGYGRYMESLGFVFDNIDARRGKLSNWELMVEDLMQWASEATDVGSFITLSPSAEQIKFKSNHGVPSVTRKTDSSRINLLNHKYQPIVDGFEVLRLDGIFSLKSKEPLYFCSISIREYEHAIYIKNRTIFSDVVFDSLYGDRKARLKVTCIKSQDWDGRLAAGGFIVNGGNIFANFETSVAEISKHTDLNYTNTSNIINKLKYHNIGFQEREYFNELEFDTSTQLEFYKGFIKQKGTYESIERFLRADNLGNVVELDIYEEWAFKVADFGGVFSDQSIELQINKDTIRNNPFVIGLEYDNYVFPEKSNSVIYFNHENDSNWIKKPSRFVQSETSGQNLFAEVDKRPNNAPRSAGFVKWDDVNYRSYDLKSFDSVVAKSKTVPTSNSSVWLARSSANHNLWDVMEMNTVGTMGVYNAGTKDKCSFIIDVGNYTIDPNAVYAVYNNDVSYTFTLKQIQNSSKYIASSFSGDVQILPEGTTEVMLSRWFSMRVADENIANALLSEFTASNNSKVYIGDDDGEWSVRGLISGVTLYSKKPYIDTSKIKNVVVYDAKTLETIRTVRLFDPLKGIYPTDAIHYLDYQVDYDPANYNKSHGYSNWGAEKVGTLWLDTSRLSYVDYEMGDDEYRSRYWGTMFAGSSVDVYEWVESYTAPASGKYVSEKFHDSRLGIESTKYYYWVKNNNVVPLNSSRKMSALEVSNAIATSHKTNGHMAILSNHSVMLFDSDNAFLNDVVVQINYQIFESKSQSHTEWQLFGEHEDRKVLPELLYDNMISSLLKHDGVKPTPYTSLPLSSLYGNGIGQNWFKDTREARRIFRERMNAFMATVNWWDVELFWQRISDIPLTSNFYSFEDWYIDGIDQYTFVSNIVDDRNLIKTLPLVHGELVKVIENVGRMPPVYNPNQWTMYRYDAINDTYEKVAQSNSAIQFNQNFVEGNFTVQDTHDLRDAINTMFEIIMVDPYSTERNSILFSLIRYVMTEQESNDWFFPTSYISVIHRAMELVQKSVYQLDKEAQITAYINEAKPFHTKLREYNKIHSAPTEIVGMHVTDFDKPPYLVTDTRDMIILQEKTIEKLIGDGQTSVFTTTFEMNSTTKVFVEGRLVESNQYNLIGGFKIEFINGAPAKGRTLIKNIVIETPNVPHRDILSKFFDTKNGYNNVYAQPLSVWMETVNQKHITATFDRVSLLPTVVLEDIASIMDGFEDLDEPRKAFTMQSKALQNTFTEIDRVIATMYRSELDDVIANSSSFVGVLTNYDTSLTNRDVVVMVGNEMVPPHLFKTKMHNGIVRVNLNFTPDSTARIFVRDAETFNTLMDKIGTLDGVANPMHTFVPNNTVPFSASLNDNNNIVVDEINSTFDDVDSGVISHGEFIEPSLVGQPEELSLINMKECIVLSSNNNLNVVRLGYGSGLEQYNTFQPISFVQVGMNPVVPITLNVHPEQLLVIVDDDEWSINMQYRVLEDRVEFIRLPREGQRVVITDRLGAYDVYSDVIRNNHKNLNVGGFDGNIIVPDFANTKPAKRDYLIYSAGNTYLLEETAKAAVTASIGLDTDVVEVDSDTFDITGDDNLFALHAHEIVDVNGDRKIKSSQVEFVTIKRENGELKMTRRGLFNDSKTIMDLSKYNVSLIKLTTSKELPALTIVEPFIGNARPAYPKYGHIVVGKDVI